MDIHQKNARQQEQELRWKQLQQIRAHEQQMQQQIPLQVAQDKMQGEFLTKIGTRNWTLYLKFSFNLFVQLIQRRIKHKVQSIIIIM